MLYRIYRLLAQLFGYAGREIVGIQAQTCVQSSKSQHDHSGTVVQADFTMKKKKWFFVVVFFFYKSILCITLTLPSLAGTGLRTQA